MYKRAAAFSQQLAGAGPSPRTIGRASKKQKVHGLLSKKHVKVWKQKPPALVKRESLSPATKKQATGKGAAGARARLEKKLADRDSAPHSFQLPALDEAKLANCKPRLAREIVRMLAELAELMSGTDMPMWRVRSSREREARIEALMRRLRKYT